MPDKRQWARKEIGLIDLIELSIRYEAANPFDEIQRTETKQADPVQHCKANQAPTSDNAPEGPWVRCQLPNGSGGLIVPGFFQITFLPILFHDCLPSILGVITR